MLLTTESEHVETSEALTCVTITSNDGTSPASPPPPPTIFPTSIRASSRKNRVYVFREFLLNTYGSSLLSKGSVVLDVAGGKGDLSWLLVNVDGLDSVVADPRLTTKHASQCKSIRYLRKNPEEALERAIPGRPTYQPLAALLPKLEEKDSFASPRHLRILVDNELVSAVRQNLDSRDDDSWIEYWKDALERASGAQPLGYREENDAATEKRQITDAMQALNVILWLKLIIGFHPDQATEACMDLAVVLRIPFCVVPCCVFPSEFPHRTTDDGARVRKYEHFIPYLQQKYPDMLMDTLDFHETNTATKKIVLYTLPDDE